MIRLVLIFSLLFSSLSFSLGATAESRKKKAGKIILSWACLEDGPLEIYYSMTNNFKEGKEDTWIKAGETQTGVKTFTFTPPSPEGNFYKFSLRGAHNSIPLWVTEK